MNVGWIDHDIFLAHDTGPGHPERADRLRAVRQALDDSGLSARLTRHEPTAIDPTALHRVHTPQYVDRVAQECAQGAPLMDSADTTICRVSYDAARTAAGGAIAACDAVMSGQWQRAFCSMRPPGHHAEADHAMGFCLFNNIAIAADYLLSQHSLSRVAIVDFDVHHGNGTQHTFEDRADVLFVSVHEDPKYLFPGTGAAEEVGHGAGEGYTFNRPMAPGAGDSDYREAFEQSVLPCVRQFAPEFLLVSAGFDGATEDPLAHIELSTDMFGWMTEQLRQVAEDSCDGRVISVMEGGYHLDALKRGVIAHVTALLDDAVA